jgi:TPR repeat protein
MHSETPANEVDCWRRLTELDERGETTLAIALCETAPCSLDVHCQRYLGWIYAGQGNPEKSIEWYRKAAMQGDSEAIEECWKCVLMIDAKGDKEKAIELCHAVPLSEYLNCQRYLAKECFARGDTEGLLSWSLKIAAHGGADDLLYVGNLYLSEGKPDLAIDFLKRAAIAGNSRAHQLLGEMYAFGVGVAENKEKAVSHYQESAKKGYLLSRIRLLHLKRRGGGTTANINFLARLPLLTLKALVIKLRDPNDPRISDIPGAKR